MSASERTKIVIASTLKPLKDARAYYRFALSLRETNKYDINIIGFLNKNEQDEQNVTFHSIFQSDRSNFKRLSLGFKFLKLLLKLKPQVMIVTTFELLPAAVFFKIIKNVKLIYDVQENYALNVKYSVVNSKVFKTIGNYFIKLIEGCSNRFIDEYIFAEKCYAKEFPTIDNYTILENKFPKEKQDFVPVKFELGSSLTFLITGTLTPLYGTLEAIHWFKALLEVNPSHQLLIKGHVPIESFLNILKNEVRSIKQIRLLLSSTPLPFSEILNAYNETDIVLLPYQQLPNISPKFPSKLFECLALGKVFLASPNDDWKKVANSYQAGFCIDFSNNDDINQILDLIYSTNFYENGMDDFPLWTMNDSRKLESLIEQ
ncbi:glycosyltransferase [Belliella sp. DSM 111904]|uniref:Glycosyltransferase n=1 Tax=Belliella filtrata TaxID=2923435 RepID=A0ABS9V4B0_9BACT|nr:glycosyltransferase [Belliella filtrata]MCH7411247.1 glycosyltransferase [Belliella filtrata]